MPTKEQLRAEYVLKKIDTMYTKGVDEENVNFITGAPTLILTNGIGQSIAFLLAKAERDNKQEKVFMIIKEWLENEIPGLQGCADNMQFLQHFSQLSMSDYLRAQDEALRMLAWLKRYARAFGR
ncbi:MAG TPA: type III-B CRISPR module-associated protein Cmr5 [Spirochaetota bacterium]|nr:type III-B CRISPR module-associated protein Cmr5 [Spirochaetota bacterium]